MPGGYGAEATAAARRRGGGGPPLRVLYDFYLRENTYLRRPSGGGVAYYYS